MNSTGHLSDYWDKVNTIKTPSTATFIELLCLDSTIKRDVHKKVVRDLSRMALDTFHDDIMSDYEGSGPDEEWGDQD